MPGTDRRSSTSSEDATLPPKQILQDGTEFIPTRTAKTGAPKPAANPLQFIKVGPCDLYKAAQEQIKKVEEIKKVEKKVKEDSEDWQSNLDNWKCSRRKIQEHIIDRVAEVKKLELEEHERNRRRGKTLNEMMEERTQKGVGPRKMSLLVYPDDDATDLTDLGISTADKNNGNEDSIAQALTSEDHPEQSNGNGTANGKKNGVNGHETSSPDPEEYTYERAIQGYKSFAEKNVKSTSKPRISPPKREPGGRIGEKLNELEQVRLRSNSVTEVQLPKVDIHKRRSLFEVVESAETKSPSAERVARDLGDAKIVKERLSSLERKPEIINSKPAPKLTDEISITIKDRLSSLEKQKSLPPRIINEEISLNTFKDRLTSLDKGLKESNSISDEEIAHKDILSPAVSEREVSSPLVSCESLGLVAEDTNTNNGDLVIKGRVEVEVDNKVEIVMKESEIVVPKVKEDLLPKTDEVVNKDEKKTDETETSVSSASEKSSNVRDTNIVTSQTDGIEISKTDGDSNIVPVNNERTESNAIEKSKTVDDSNNVPVNKHDIQANYGEISKPVKDSNIVPDNMPSQSKAGDIFKTVDVPNNNERSEDKSKTVEDPNIVPDNIEPSESCASKISTIVEDLNFVPDNKPPQAKAKEISKAIDVPDNNEPSKEESKAVEDANIVPDNNESTLLTPNTTESCAKKESPIKPPLKLVVNRKVAPTPSLRKRKLTPMLTAPIAVLSPVMSPGVLQIISEDFPIISSNNDLTEIDEEDSEEITKPVPAPRGQGAETSESGIDMEESSLYTDENIDEVLGVDDVGDDDEDDYSKVVDEENVPDSAKDLEISRRQMIQERGREDSGYVDFEKSFTKQSESIKLDASLEIEPPCDGLPFEAMNQLTKQQEAVTRFDELIGYSEIMPNKSEIMENIKNKEINGELNLNEEVKKPIQPLIDLSEPIEEKQPPPLYENIITANQMLDLSNPGEILSFPLSPMTSVEPPKEKPPPPPIDLSDEETEAPELPPKTSLRRLDSTKRIKKEIRKKRSDFLGIEGANDDAYLEPEVNVEPPPDMMKLLEEERRLDQQLYRQSLSSEADSTENVQIHTSAVDRLEKSLFLDQSSYRQSICSESDSNHETAESRDSGVELDRGHVDDLCWNKQGSEPHSRQNSEPYGNPSITSEEDEISKKEREIIEVLEKEEERRYGKNLAAQENREMGESLADKLRQLEHEKLQLEWERAEEEGRRMADEERILAKETLLRQQETTANINQLETAVSQENLRAERERLEKEQIELARVRQELLVRQRSSEHPRQSPMTSNLRYSMPDLQDSRPPPSNSRPPNTWTRVPSADNLLSPQQMSRTTLQALSAAPRSRIVNGEAWMQPKRKADAPKSNYNYQHWLIQEAEHRRITEQQQRATQSRRSLPNQPRPTSQFSPNQHPLPQQRPHSGHYPNHVSTAPYAPTQPIISPSQNGVHYASQSLPSSPRVAQPPHAHTHVHSPMSPPSHHTIGLPPTPPVTHPHQQSKPLPDSVIQTLTQRVQNKTSPRRRVDERPSPTKVSSPDTSQMNGDQERMLSVSGKKKCSHCGEELGRGAAMVIESLRLFYHIDCFKCCVCHTQLGDGLMGTDVRVRNNKLHCHNCYSSDDDDNFSFSKAQTMDGILSDEDCKHTTSFSQYCCCSTTSLERSIENLVTVLKESEERRFLEFQMMNLRLIEFEIRNYELFKNILSELSKEL